VAASRCLDVSINSTQVQKKQKIKTRFSRSAKISHRSKTQKEWKRSVSKRQALFGFDERFEIFFFLTSPIESVMLHQVD
jgi:hypothetical protein